MLINLRNALMAGKRLPYDAEVEFLQSSGTQYVNTGVKFTADNARVKFTASVTYANDTALCGSQNHSAENNYGFLCYLYSNAMRIYAGTSNTGATASLVDGNAHTVDLQANSGTLTKTIDGTISTHNYNGTIVSGEDFTIFTSWKVSGSSMTARCVSAKIYAFQIWNNGVLVRDFIPVRKGTVGYLYDRVTGKLFGNAGTGDFVVGQDVVPVEYIESHGTEYIETGVTLSASTQFKVDICPTYSTGDRKYLGSDAASFGLCQLNGKWRLRVYGWNLTSIDVVTDSFTIVEKNTNGWFINGTNVYADWYPRAAVPFLCFAWLASNNTIETASALCKISHLEITDNATLVRSFLSVRVGTEGAMIDTLTRRIYRNAGTGAFTYGNDLKYPIPAS